MGGRCGCRCRGRRGRRGGGGGGEACLRTRRKAKSSVQKDVYIDKVMCTPRGCADVMTMADEKKRRAHITQWVRNQSSLLFAHASFSAASRSSSVRIRPNLTFSNIMV